MVGPTGHFCQSTIAPHLTETMANPSDVTSNGWTAVSRAAPSLFSGKAFLHPPKPLSLADLQFPSNDPVVAKAQQYAKSRMDEQTFNHSMRVYYFGNYSDFYSNYANFF